MQGLQREGSGSLPSSLHTGTSPADGAEARCMGRPKCTELSGKTRTDGGRQAVARSRSWPLSVSRHCWSGASSRSKCVVGEASALTQQRGGVTVLSFTSFF